MGILHNLVIIGPDGMRYLVQKIDEPVNNTPVITPSEPENVRHKIRSLRKNKKWSQTELGSRAGITQATISRIESGETDPHDGTIEQLLSVLTQ